jgi:hypothetical protein
MSGFELPNTTPVPNEIINGWMQRLKGSELKVLLLVVRKTLGWIVDPNTGMRKEEDWLSYKQLNHYTGLHSEALSSAIDALVKYELIQVRNEKGEELDSKEKRRAFGRRRLSLFYRLNLNTLKQTSHYFNNSTTSKIEQVKSEATTSILRPALLRKSNSTKSNTLQKSIYIQRGSKYSSIKAITPEVLQDIATSYKVSVGFVNLQFEKMKNWLESNGKQKKDYRATLRNFVLSSMEKEINHPRKGGVIDGTNL